DPRVLGPALLHAAIHALPFTLRMARQAVPAAARAVRGVVRLLLLLALGIGRLLAALVRRLGAAVLRAHRAIDYPALARPPRIAHTEGLAQRYDDASGGAGPGFARELAGAVLLVGCGLGLLRLAPRRPRRARRARRTEVAGAASPPAPVA